MEFKIGQKVRIKPESPFARFTGGDVLTVKLVSTAQDTICVTTSTRGSHWVKSADLEPFQTEPAVQ